MNPCATQTSKAPLPVLLIAVLVALLLGSQVLGSVKAADLDMQAAHQTHAQHAGMDAMPSHDVPPSDDMPCETGACCADMCSQVGLNSVASLHLVPGRHHPALRPVSAGASRLGAIYRPPRQRV